MARLVRMGRERQFSLEAFEKALRAAAASSTRGALLRELLVEWTGVTVNDDQAVAIWEAVTGTLLTLEKALGQPVSLQTALLHELHTQRGLVREPRLLSDARALRPARQRHHRPPDRPLQPAIPLRPPAARDVARRAYRAASSR